MSNTGHYESPLVRAARVQAQVDSRGMGWQRIEGVLEKIDEEVSELKAALASSDEGKAREEVGDILFSLVTICRFLNLNPDSTLESSINKFSRRINRVESYLRSLGKSMESTSPEELDLLWQKAKSELRRESQQGCG